MQTAQQKLRDAGKSGAQDGKGSAAAGCRGSRGAGRAAGEERMRRIGQDARAGSVPAPDGTGRL